jgi:hypothetical protein
MQYLKPKRHLITVIKMTLRRTQKNHGTLKRLIDDKYNRDLEILCSHLAILPKQKVKRPFIQILSSIWVRKLPKGFCAITKTQKH